MTLFIESDVGCPQRNTECRTREKQAQGLAPALCPSIAVQKAQDDSLKKGVDDVEGVQRNAVMVRVFETTEALLMLMGLHEHCTVLVGCILF